MSQYCVIGRGGLIGGAIAKRLGDVTSIPTKDTRVLFHFGSHTHPKFEINPEFEMSRVISEFMELLPYCYQHGIQFVYPSSALVYEKESQFSRFKKTLEMLAGCYKTRTLGLRIFPTYGPSESHTVISQWCRQIKSGERPVVYGDGKQSRDFIFIDDVVDQILLLLGWPGGGNRIVDIGTGIQTSFNEIIEQINYALGSNIQPRYVERPSSYSEGISCASPLPVKVPIDIGIKKILEAI
jgi:nucleoside-diphosphate-sugar epimerase